MPEGELSPVIYALFTSALPSPSASRSRVIRFADGRRPAPPLPIRLFITAPCTPPSLRGGLCDSAASTSPLRSEEHTSELQSLMRISYAVFCLKKKNKN